MVANDVGLDQVVRGNSPRAPRSPGLVFSLIRIRVRQEGRHGPDRRPPGISGLPLLAGGGCCRVDVNSPVAPVASSVLSCSSRRTPIQ